MATTKRTLSLGGILDKSLTGGFVEKTISASKRFASLPDEEKKALLNTGSDIQTTAPLKPEVLQKNIELKEGMQKAAAKKFFNFEKSPLSISAAPTELIEAQKSPEAAAAYEKEQARRRLQYVRQNEGYFPAVGEALKQYGQAKVEAMQPVLEFADTAATKVEEQGHPILGGAVRGAKGLYQSSVGATGEAARQLGEGNVGGAAFTYGLGKLMNSSPTGMAWTAVMEQKPVKEHVQPVLDAWNNELDTFFAEQKNNPFSPMGAVLKESGKLLPFLLFDKVSRIPFKSKKTITLQNGKTFEIPVDRKWYADAKQEVFNDILQLANDPAKFFKEKQFGLSIKAVGDEAERGKMTSLKDMRTKLPRAGIEKPAPLPDYTTRVLDMLGDRKTVSRQFINDLTNRPELRQPERDLIRSKLSEFQGDTIDVPEFAASVRGDVLPLKRMDAAAPGFLDNGKQLPMGYRYEGITLPKEQRGDVKNYSEHVYSSPIKTSAASVHFDERRLPNYFAHTRIEDLPDNTRRVIEVQSDLFQKGRLESETQHWGILKGNENLNMLRDRVGEEGIIKMLEARKKEVAKLEPYRNTWYERVIREEVKQASKDGKTKVQFPTGDTAMMIEGLGTRNNWFVEPKLTMEQTRNMSLSDVSRIYESNRLTPNKLEVGLSIRPRGGDVWIVTRTAGDTGIFKAVPKEWYDNVKSGVIEKIREAKFTPDEQKKVLSEREEQFDIGGQLDVNNPIYKYYEKDVQKFLKREYPDMKRVTDAQGVEWFEVDTTPKPGQLSYGEKPVFAFKEKPREGGISEEARARADLQKTGELRGNSHLPDGTFTGMKSTFPSTPISPEQPLTKKQFVEQEKNALAGEMSGLESEIRGTAMREVIEPMITAEAGKRFQLPDGTFTGIKSTFPDWVPKHLRSRVMFDKVVSLISENKPTPTNAKKLAELRGLVEAKIEERVKAHELYPELTDMKSYMTGLEKGFIGSPSPKRQLAEQSSSIGLELSRWDRARIKLQDRFLPVQKLQEKLVKEGGKITDESNIYLQEELYYGKTTDALSRFEEEKVKPIVEEVINSSAGGSKAHQTLKDSIDRYLYLSHAPERNAKLGDGAAGITTQEARIGLEQLKQTPQWPIIEKAGLKVRQLANDLPRFLVENDLIDEKAYSALKDAYENYVPLQRILPEGENIAQTLGVGKGFDVRGKDIKRAMGSDKPVQDIFESIIINWQRAIVRAEKNKVGLSVVKLILDNPKLKEVFEVIPGKPKAFEVGGQEIFYREAPKLPNVMVVKKGGKDIFIKINDADVASALKNLGTQNANILMKYIAPATRLYSSMNTSFNPEFIFTNPVKDIQQAALNISSELGGSAGVKLAPEVAKAVKGIGDYLRGRKNTEWGKLYDELKEQGGTTGFFQIKDRLEVGRTLKEMENEFSRSALGMPIRSAKKVLHGVEALNEMMENGTRLAAYKIALDSGKSKPQAASIAKNITVNFNRKGEWGSAINSLYAFANASIQGSFRTFKALKDPKTALKLITTIAAPSLAVNAWNDAIDEETHKKIPEYERQTNFIIMIGGGDYIKIPVPWGWNVFKVMADQSYDLATGKKQTPSNALIKSIAAFANAYNPLNGDSVLSSITPTLLRPLFDIKANTSWTGSPIAPQNYQKLKDSLNYYDSTNPMFIHIAEKLSELTGGKGAKPGAVEISPEALEYLYDQYGGGVLKTLKNAKVSTGRVIAGEDLVPKEIPIARRFFGRVNDEQFNKTSIYDTLVKAQEEILSPEDRKLLRNSLSLEIEAGRTTKEEAQKKMKDFDRYQIDLQQVEKAAKYIQERKLEGEKLEKFLRALQDEKFMKDREGGVFNQTQLKILRSKL